MRVLPLRSVSFFTLLTALFFFIGSSSSLQAAWKRGADLPALASFSPDGTLPDLKGKVVLVDFWASWCAPCKQSFPTLDKLQKTYKDKGLVIVAISVDDKKEDMKRFLGDKPWSMSIIHDAKHSIVADASVETMPSSFVVDRSGKIRFAHVGFAGAKTEAEYVAQIETLLAEK